MQGFDGKRNMFSDNLIHKVREVNDGFAAKPIAFFHHLAGFVRARWSGRVQTCPRQNKPPSRRRKRPHRRSRIAADPAHKGRPHPCRPCSAHGSAFHNQRGSAAGGLTLWCRLATATFGFLSPLGWLHRSSSAELRFACPPAFNPAATAVQPRTNGSWSLPCSCPGIARFRRPLFRLTPDEGAVFSVFNGWCLATAARTFCNDLAARWPREAGGEFFLWLLS